MYYLVQKFDHEMFIQDTFEGKTLLEGIEKKFKETEVIMGTDIDESLTTPKEMFDWINDDNYEFTSIIESKSPFKFIK